MSLYLRINSKHLFFKVRQFIKNDARRNQKEYFKQIMLALAYLKINKKYFKRTVRQK